MTPKQQAAMQQALEALEWASDLNSTAQNYRPLQDSIAALREALAEPVQEPVAWMHNEIEDNIITHRPSDIDCHSERWTALYKEPLPCPTCESLARAVMLDQTYYESRAVAEPVQEPVQNPVAWIHPRHLQEARVSPIFCLVEPTQRCADFLPIYTAPPQRKPLPASEIVTMYDESPRGDSDMIDFARAIEAAHGIT